MAVVLAFLEAYPRVDFGDSRRPVSFDESDLRLANRAGARISAAEIAVILEQRRAIEQALRAIAPTASLVGAASSVPWLPLERLFHGFAEIRGVGFSKVTKALHAKRPALIPILDSVVQEYLKDDDLGAKAPFAERALGLIRGYKGDLDRNLSAVRGVRQELRRRSHDLSDVRILDLVIWSVFAGSTGLSVSLPARRVVCST